MHRPGLIEALIVSTSMLILLIFVLRNLPKPPRPPRHPVPGQEPPLLHVLLRIRRHKADSWHF
jgi:hypothetical protein